MFFFSLVVLLENDLSALLWDEFGMEKGSPRFFLLHVNGLYWGIFCVSPYRGDFFPYPHPDLPPLPCWVRLSSHHKCRYPSDLSELLHDKQDEFTTSSHAVSWMCNNLSLWLVSASCDGCWLTWPVKHYVIFLYEWTFICFCSTKNCKWLFKSVWFILFSLSSAKAQTEN